MNYIDISQPPYSQVLDGHTDNTAAIQAALTALSSGVLLIPGSATVSQTIVIDKPVTIRGYGRAVSSIGAIGDIQVVHFTPTCDNAGMQDISVYGLQSAASTARLVYVEGAAVHLAHMRIWGGYTGLRDSGVDGLRHDIYVAGFGTGMGGACVVSNGANWWVRCKIDAIPGSTPQFGFYQGSPAPGQTSCENRFTECDFSGSFQMSLQIEDGGVGSADMGFDGCIFSSPVSAWHGAWARFTGCKFGAAVAVGSCPTSISDSWALTPFSFNGQPNVHLANNIGIT